MDERLLLTRELSSLSEDTMLNESNELVADALRTCCTLSCSDDFRVSTSADVVFVSMMAAMLVAAGEIRLGLGAYVVVGGEAAEKAIEFDASPETTIDGDISCEIVCETVMSLE